jgi:AhpD family alkylhydroperoxidase
MTAVEILSAKQKSLIGVGASIAAGCQPCTLSFVSAARKAGACDRGIRAAVESGLAGRERASAAMSDFASAELASPEIDAAFRAERAPLDALIGVAGAIASNTASLVKPCVDTARALGATEDQIRIAAEIARAATRGAERETDLALGVELGGVQQGARAPEPRARPGGTRSCGCGEPAPATDFETIRLEKTTNTCSLCEEYAAGQAHKPIVVMSCEGACLRGEISRQAANHLCHALVPEKTARLCLGAAFTKDAGQRALVREARKVVALEGCPIRCASRMMRAHFPGLAPEVIVTDGLCEFDRSLFGAEALAPEVIHSLGRTVAAKVAATL